MENKKRKIHIALVGGQPAPVFYGIKATEPDTVVLICSEASQRQAESIKAFFPNLSFGQTMPLTEFNPGEIIERANSLCRTYFDDEVCLNISSGLKSWSHLFAESFRSHPDCHVIYIDQENRLWDYATNEFKPIEYVGVLDHLKLYGNTLESFKRLEDYAHEDIEAIDILRSARDFNNNHFRKLLAVVDHKSWVKKLEKRPSGAFYLNELSGFEDTDSYVNWAKPRNGSRGRVTIFLEDENDHHLERFSISSPHAMDLAFNSGWFEIMVADILSRWDKAKEIFVNCHFKTKKNADKNEIDVIVQTSTRILFVECKTALTKITDIDKFKNAVKNYGGTACHGIFITMDPVNEVALEKCRDSKLLQPFSINMQLPIPTEEALFMLLDEAIQQINII